jgi:branched-subunit amino acid aminotransferase/4-amino-4-deoxychorismate lyase
VPATDVAIPLDDAGLVWGAIATDRLRTFHGQPFRLDEHLRRFRTSCELARVPQPRADTELAEIFRRLLTENWAGVDLSLIWLATPGPPAKSSPTLIAYTHPLNRDYLLRLDRAGAHLITTACRPPIDPRIKHRSRLAWWIAARDVSAVDPAAEPLFVDPSTGQILETTTASLLAVIDGVVTSPPTSTVLEGVSLAVVRELCGGHSIPFAERALAATDLVWASEILLTNTSYCVAGVSQIDGRLVAFPGPILNRLLDAWTELVGADVRPQPES